MSDLGDGSNPGSKKGASPARIGVWVVVAAVGVYLLGSGIIGIISGGS